MREDLQDMHKGQAAVISALFEALQKHFPDGRFGSKMITGGISKVEEMTQANTKIDDIGSRNTVILKKAKLIKIIRALKNEQDENHILGEEALNCTLLKLLGEELEVIPGKVDQAEYGIAPIPMSELTRKEAFEMFPTMRLLFAEGVNGLVADADIHGKEKRISLLFNNLGLGGTQDEYAAILRGEATAVTVRPTNDLEEVTVTANNAATTEEKKASTPTESDYYIETDALKAEIAKAVELASDSGRYDENTTIRDNAKLFYEAHIKAGYTPQAAKAQTTAKMFDSLHSFNQDAEKKSPTKLNYWGKNIGIEAHCYNGARSLTENIQENIFLTDFWDERGKPTDSFHARVEEFLEKTIHDKKHLSNDEKEKERETIYEKRMTLENIFKRQGLIKWRKCVLSMLQLSRWDQLSIPASPVIVFKKKLTDSKKH